MSKHGDGPGSATSNPCGILRFRRSAFFSACRPAALYEASLPPKTKLFRGAVILHALGSWNFLPAAAAWRGAFLNILGDEPMLDRVLGTALTTAFCVFIVPSVLPRHIRKRLPRSFPGHLSPSPPRSRPTSRPGSPPPAASSRPPSAPSSRPASRRALRVYPEPPWMAWPNSAVRRLLVASLPEETQPALPVASSRFVPRGTKRASPFAGTV